jgi:hypothetical protein
MGHPKAGGRRKGTPNKATADVKAMAGVYTGEAVAMLVAIMRRKTASDAVRLAAARELFDRGCGRPGQALTGEIGTGPVSFTLIEKLYPNR